MKSGITALTVLALLTACAGGNSNPHGLMLPDVPEYSKSVQQKAAGEMTQSCGLMPTVCDVFMPDYKVMRDQVRGAREVLK